MQDETKDQKLEEMMSAMHNLSRPAEGFRQQLSQETSAVITRRAKRRTRPNATRKPLALAVAALAAAVALIALWQFGVFSAPDQDDAGLHIAGQPPVSDPKTPGSGERESEVISGDDLQALIARLGGKPVEHPPDMPLVAGNYDPWQLVALDELVRNSDVIVSAKVKQTKSGEFVRVKAGRKVVEDFTTVTIRKSFRGGFQADDEVVVRSIRGSYSACGGGDPEFAGNENVLLFLRKDPQPAAEHVFRSAVFFRGRAFQAKKFIVKNADEIPQGKAAIYFDENSFKHLRQLVEKYERTEETVRWRANFNHYELSGLQMTGERLFVSATKFDLHERAKYYVFALSDDGKIVGEDELSAPGTQQGHTHAAVHSGKLTVRDLFGEAQRWSIQLPLPWSDRIFLGDGIVLSVQPKAVHAFRLRDGRREWSFSLPADDGRAIDVPRPAFSSASVFLKTRKWTGTTGQFRLYALDRKSGNVQWENDAGTGTGSLHASVILGDHLIDVGGGTTVTAYDIKTGALQWESEVQRLPTALSASGKSVLVATGDGQLRSLSPETGNEVWKTPLKLYGRGRKAPPIVHDRSVYVFTDDFHLLCLDAASGKIEWDVRASSTVKPVIDNQTLYFLNENRRLYALDINKAKKLGRSMPMP